MKSGSLDYWRKYFRTANSDIFDIIHHAILVAVSDCPKEFKLQRDGIAERLFSSKLSHCLGCDRVELAVSCDEEGGGYKSGLEAGASKESKVDSIEDDHEDINTNQAISIREAEALTDMIEEESQTQEEVLRIKEILMSEGVSDSLLFESLRRLQLMQLNLDVLQATEIGVWVSKLRKHGSKLISQLARTLYKVWKEMALEWLKVTNTEATKAATVVSGTESNPSPDSVNPTVVDEEEVGLPSPPMDEGAFLSAPTGSMELSQFFDGMDDDGNFRQTEELTRTQEDIRKPSSDSQIIAKRKPQISSEAKESKSNQVKKDEVAERVNKQVISDSGPGRPPKSSLQQESKAGPNIQQKSNTGPNMQQKSSTRPTMQQKSNTVPNMQQKLDKSVIPKRPLVGQQDKFKCSDDALVEAKLEATKRKLHESYQQAANAKRQRKIQVMELRDLPKQGNGPRNTHTKPGSHSRLLAHGRR